MGNGKFFHRISKTNPRSKPFSIRALPSIIKLRGFSLDSQPSWPYHLNHKQVLTVAFPSNLILPYIALARARGLFRFRQMVSIGALWAPF